MRPFFQSLLARTILLWIVSYNVLQASLSSGVNAGPNCCCKPHINASPNATKCDGVAPNCACWCAEWVMGTSN